MTDRESEFPQNADVALELRLGLPDALRVLLDEFPRGSWEENENFGKMVQFWLQRHLMFREVLRRMTAETQAVEARDLDFARYAPRLSRLGGFLLQELHMHHHIEDLHYFPRLVVLDPRLARGFDILDADHKALDALLGDFADAANKVLRGGESATSEIGRLAESLIRFDGFLDRHLTDEEDLIVPVILKTGFEA